MNKNFKNNLINKIKKEEIKPISKNYFIAKNILIYLFLWFSILIWALSIAIIFWYLFEADWYLSHKLGLLKITTTFLPIFWIIFLIISIIISYFNFKNTSKWYKFYLWQIILVNIVSSIIIWTIFYISWFSNILEEKIQNNLPEYRKYFVQDNISRMKKVWQNEDSWLLLGLITEKISENSFKLKDTNNKVWKIIKSKKSIIRHNLEIKKWLKIKLIWEKISENIFKVNEIRPFIWKWQDFQKNKNINYNTETKKNMNTTKNFTDNFFGQLSVLEFKKEMNDPNKIIIDVRTPGEIPIYWRITDNEMLIDISNENFTSEIAKLDKTKKYLIYCWHGNRSQVARDYMQSQWFTYVKDLQWWIDEWVNEWESIFD